MPVFGLFGPPNVRDLLAKGDVEGLIKIIQTHKSTNNIEKSRKWMHARRDAVEALGQLRATSAGEALLAALHDSDDIVRFNAIAALGKIGDSRAVESLIAILNDNQKRFRAVEALRQIGKVAVQGLISALKSRNYEVRLAVIAVLSSIGDNRAIEPLIANLKDENDEVRRAAAAALGAIGDNQVVETLVTALHHSNQAVRWQAAETLETLGDARVVEAFIAALKAADVEIRREMVRRLGRIGDVRAVEPLMALLPDPDTQVHRAVINAFGQISDVRAVEVLTGYLDDNDLRSEAALSLARNSQWQTLSDVVSKKLVEVFEPMIEFNHENDLAQSTLLRLNTEDSLRVAVRDFDELRSSLGISWSRLRENAYARYVAFFESAQPDSKTFRNLSALAQDSNSDVRRATALALGRTRSEEAIIPLKSLLQDPDFWVRSTAHAQLDDLGYSPQTDSEKIYYFADSPRQIEDLKKLSGSIEILLQFLKGPDVSHRWQVIEQLQLLGWKAETVEDQVILNIADSRRRGRGLSQLGSTAINPILKYLSSEDARLMICELELILRQNIAEVPADDLLGVTRLANIHQAIYFNDSCGYFSHNEPVDCMQVIQLARQELIRRGEQA